MAELIGSILVLLGAVFLFSAGLGMLRMPDAFTRIQAGTRPRRSATCSCSPASPLYHPGWNLKLVIIIYFVLLTNPISSHALARTTTPSGFR